MEYKRISQTPNHISAKTDCLFYIELLTRQRVIGTERHLFVRLLTVHSDELITIRL